MLSELQALRIDLDRVTDDVTVTFSDLKPEQLNWKPGPEGWSVGQCFEHLNSANAGMVKAISAKIEGTSPVTFYERLPFLPTMFGRLISNAVSPGGKRKIKAPKVFEPSLSDVDPQVVEQFVDFQPAITALMEKCSDSGIIMGSPAAAFITYRLLDAFTIVVRHEQRHFDQAKRVTQTAGFPV
ncbi:MAG: DinB family protein [Acidobacteria bacterium]|nr:DinB family protein [Acidobacteriota bacterium]